MFMENLKKLWPIRLDCKKKAVSGNESQVNQQSEGSNQPESTRVKTPNIDSKELGRSVQAASQALKSTHTITGKQLEHEDKPGYYDRVGQSVLGRLSIFNDLVKKFADIITDTQKMDQNILDLFETLDTTYKFIEESTEIQNHPSYQRILSSLAKQTQECAYFIQSYAKKQNFCTRVGMNIIGEPVRLRVESYQDSFKKLLGEFGTHSALHTEISVSRLLEINESMVETFDLNNLSYAYNAGLNKGKQCLPGTRVEVLEEIVDWINDNDDNCPRLFWLAGSAGMGKSAIAHSIASRFKSIKRLGSCFCFDKNSLERRDKIFSTIARGLASLDLQIKHELAKIIKDEYSLCHSTDLQLQWEKLISEPLRALSDVSIGPILIVIDGLDESGDSISRQGLLMILEKEIPALPANFRFLITSRPENDIRHAFVELQSHIRSKMMNEIPGTETNRDILTYFKATLKFEIKDDSFGDAELERLVDRSQGLFQWAYLASNFLTGLGNRAGSTISDRYEDLINAQHIQSINNPLDAMYTQILSSLFDLKDSRVMSRFRSVMGSIVAASEPLSLDNLIELRGKGVSLSVRKTDIKAVIQYMGSLLNNIDNPSSPIRPLHLSFREYLLDHNRSHEFYIDPSHCHRDFAIGCLRTMMKELRFNICNMSSSHIRNIDDKGLPERISSSISPQLSYASRHWAEHVSLTAFDPLVAERVEEFLNRGFLLWLEAVPVAARSMSSIISWCSGKESQQTLHAFAVDGKRFVQLFGGTIAQSAPHVYLSALPFCPQKSVIYKRFIGEFPNTLRIVSEAIHEWPLGSRRTTMGSVQGMSFSHGGQYLAVAGRSENGNIITVLDPETLVTLWIVRSPGPFPYSCDVGFSTGDKSLVFASHYNVYSFEILMGSLTILLSDFPTSPNRQLISQDAKFIAFYYHPHYAESKLTVWNLYTREQIINIPVNSCGISYQFDKGSFITYHRGGIEAQIRNLETGVIQVCPMGPQLLDSLKTHLRDGHAHMLASDAQIVFAGYYYSYLWDYRDNSIITFEGNCLGITPDGDSIITYVRRGILLRDKNGSKLHCPATNDVKESALSKDGNRLAIADDGDVHILDFDGWKSYARRNDHSFESTTFQPPIIAVSPDGKYFLPPKATPGYYDIWDIRLGQPIGKFHALNRLKFQPVFSSMSRYLGYPSAEDTVNLYTIDSGIIQELSFGDRKVDVDGIAFSQDETLLATLDIRQGTIHTWNIESSQIVDTVTIPNYKQPERLVYFGASSTLQYFAYGFTLEGSRSIFLCDHSGPISFDFLSDLNYWEDFTFSADEKYMIISHGSKISHLNLITGKRRVILLEPLEEIAAGYGHHIFAFFNSDIRLLRYGTYCGVNMAAGCQIWDASSGELLHSFLLDYPDIWVESFIHSSQHMLTSTKSCTRVLEMESEKDWICFSSNEQHSLRSLPLKSSVKLRSDGWVITQNGELLFWVPHDYHQRLHLPKVKYAIGMELTELDLSSFSHGESWASCKPDSNSNL